MILNIIFVFRKYISCLLHTASCTQIAFSFFAPYIFFKNVIPCVLPAQPRGIWNLWIFNFSPHTSEEVFSPVCVPAQPRGIWNLLFDPEGILCS